MTKAIEKDGQILCGNCKTQSLKSMNKTKNNSKIYLCENCNINVERDLSWKKYCKENEKTAT